MPARSGVTRRVIHFMVAFANVIVRDDNKKSLTRIKVNARLHRPNPFFGSPALTLLSAGRCLRRGSRHT